MSRTERKSLIRSRAAALGLLSVASFLVTSQARASIAAQNRTNGENGENVETFRPLPSPRHSDPSALSPAERSRLVMDVRAYHRAADAAAWEAGKSRGMWLNVRA
jgi:hypothetical protein